MHTQKGLARFPQILTDADVLRHCYGVTDAESASLIPDPMPEPEPVAEIPPPAPEETPAPEEPVVPEETPAPEESAPEEKDVPATPEEMIASLEHDNTKAELVAMAEAAGLDQSGNKPDLAARLVAHYSKQ